jgi:hypothetical protein
MKPYLTQKLGTTFLLVVGGGIAALGIAPANAAPTTSTAPATSNIPATHDWDCPYSTVSNMGQDCVYTGNDKKTPDESSSNSDDECSKPGGLKAWPEYCRTHSGGSGGGNNNPSGGRGKNNHTPSAGGGQDNHNPYFGAPCSATPPGLLGTGICAPG